MFTSHCQKRGVLLIVWHPLLVLLPQLSQLVLVLSATLLTDWLEPSTYTCLFNVKNGFRNRLVFNVRLLEKSSQSLSSDVSGPDLDDCGKNGKKAAEAMSLNKDGKS